MQKLESQTGEVEANRNYQEAAIMLKAGEPRLWAEDGTKIDLSKRRQSHGGGATPVRDAT